MERKRLNELLKVVGIQCSDNRIIKGITCHSSHVSKDWLFVAIEGNKTSGYSFKQNVINKGGIIVTEREDSDCFRVNDSRVAYSLLLHAFHGQPSMKLKVIGITGTNGKSTTAVLLRQLLENQNYRCALIGTDGIMYPDKTLSTQNTTPSSEQIVMAMNYCINHGINFLIIEISSMAMHQKRCMGVLLDVLIYTQIAQDHLEEHGSLMNYINAKKSMMKLLKPHGVMIYNHDDSLLCEFAQSCSNAKLSYGQSSFQFKINKIEEYQDSTSFSLNNVLLTIPLLSRINAYNCTAALAAGFALDLNWEKMLTKTSSLDGAPGRFEKVDCDMAIYVDYAHTEKAMEQALKTFSGMKKGRLIVVFGCGGNRDRNKRSKMGKLACQYAEIVILTSDNPRNEDPIKIIQDIQDGCDGREIVEVNRIEAIKKAVTSYRKGDIIALIGKGAEKIQKWEKTSISLSDREIVLSILNGEDY